MWDVAKDKVKKRSVNESIDTLVRKHGIFLDDLPYYLAGRINYIAKLIIKYKDIEYEFLVISKKGNTFNDMRILIHPPSFSGFKYLKILFGFDDNQGKYNPNYAYVANISEGAIGSGEKSASGTDMVKLADLIMKKLSVTRAYLTDASNVYCENVDGGISLSLLKLLQKGISWYQKLGYQIDYVAIKTAYPTLTKKKIDTSLSKLRNLKMNNVMDELITRRKFLNFIIENSLYRYIYLSDPDIRYNDIIININSSPERYVFGIKKLITDHLIACNEAIVAIRSVPNYKTMKLSTLVDNIMKRKECEKYSEIVNNLFLVKTSFWEGNIFDIYTLVYSTESAIPAQKIGPKYNNKKNYISKLSWSNDFLVIVIAYNNKLVKDKF